MNYAHILNSGFEYVVIEMYKLRTSLRLAVDGDLQIAAVSEALSILAGDEVRQPAASSIRSHPGSCAASRISSRTLSKLEREGLAAHVASSTVSLLRGA